MNGRHGILAMAAVLALAACDRDDAAERLEAQAEQLERAAEQAPDEAQAEVLRNQAKALREAAEGEKPADANGSVIVVKE